MECFPIIVSSPSGGGKTTIVAELLKKDKTLARVITATTRSPRKGEKDGRDYHFWTQPRFEAAIKNKQMVEWAKVHLNYYGIPKSSFDLPIKKGKCPVLIIDVQGAKTVKKIFKNAVSIFIAPPSLKELEKRIAARNDGTTDIKVRMAAARKELEHIKDYDYAVVNDILKDAVKDCAAIIKAERLKTNRRSGFTKNLK